jgi:long-chain acyl-CoA synthetase
VIGNLADLVSAAADDRPGHVAIIEGGRQTTYAGLDSAISAFASGLAQQGVGRGDRVGIMLGNSVHFVVAYFGVLRRGAVAVPLNTGLAVDEILHAIGDVGPVLLVVDQELRSHVELAVHDTGTPVLVPGSQQWERLIAAGRQSPLPPVATDPESLAVLLFTAGSTGRPKAAMLTHRALAANVEEMLALDDPPAITRDDTVLCVLPLFHVYSLNTVLAVSLAEGATVLLEPRFAGRATLELVRDAGVTMIAGAPPIYVAWSAEPDLRAMLEGVRLMSSGASPLPPALFEQFLTLAGQPIWEGYGLTECSPVVSTTLVAGRPKAGCVGLPLPGLEVLLVDTAGDPVEDGTGEIWVRGDSLFSGYWPDRAGGPGPDGWFATGDVGLVDADGDLRLVDRRKELIIVSGFNVYPREVERVISELPQVSEVAVIGVAHPYTGEAVKAFVVPRADAYLDSATVLNHCETRLARFKCPTIVEIMPDLPHSIPGKVSKGRLRELSQA